MRHFSIKTDLRAYFCLLTIMVFLVFLFACSCNDSPSGKPQNIIPAATGSIGLDLKWDSPLNFDLSASGLQSRGKEFSVSPSGNVCQDYGITDIRADVYSDNLIKIKSQEFTCTDNKGVIDKVPTGHGMNIIIQGIVGGAPKWKGETTDPVSVYAGETTTVTIVMSYDNTSYPDPSPGAFLLAPFGGGTDTDIPKNVPIDSSIIVGFTEDIIPYTVLNMPSFKLLDPNQRRVAGTITYNTNSFTATLKPNNPLLFNTEYEVVLDTNIMDRQATPLDKEYTWNFWTTDITAIVKDITRTTLPSNPHSLIYLNGNVFFFADDGTGSDTETGYGLWKTDGTKENTQRVKLIDPSRKSTITKLTEIGNKFFFVVKDTNKNELWVSDGTDPNTQKIKDDLYVKISPQLRNYLALKDLLFFVADDGDGSNYELWMSDGTVNGTKLVADLDQDQNKSSNLRYFTNVNNEIFFVAETGPNSSEIWKIDLNAPNIDLNTLSNNLVKAVKFNVVCTGTTDCINYVDELINIEGTLFFRSSHDGFGYELWSTEYNDTNNVVRLADIYEGTGDSTPNQLINVNGKLFFVAWHKTLRQELCYYDKSNGIVRIININTEYNQSSYPEKLTSINDKLFFVALISGKYWLCRIDTSTLTGVNDNSKVNKLKEVDQNIINNLTSSNEILFFTYSDDLNGAELWKADTIIPGASIVKDIRQGPNGSGIGGLIDAGGILYFAANDGIYGLELWKSDGTDFGTLMVADINDIAGATPPKELTNVGGTLFFVANDGIHGFELWKSDGTDSGTLLIDLYEESFVGNPKNLKDINGTLFFSIDDPNYGTELARIENKDPNTLKIFDINKGRGSSNPKDLTHVDGWLFFIAEDTERGAEVCKMNLTDTNMRTAFDIREGSDTSDPRDLTNVDGTLFFSANNGKKEARELWKIDADSNIPSFIDINKVNFASSNPSNLFYVNYNNKPILFFNADDGSHGRELCVISDKDPNKLEIVDIRNGSVGSNPRDMINMDNKLFFIANIVVDNEEKGSEVYMIEIEDPNYTITTYDINPGPAHSSPNYLTVFNNFLFFAARNEDIGTELWRIDTAANDPNDILYPYDIQPLKNDSMPKNLTIVDNTLFFVADYANFGFELLKISYEDINRISLVKNINEADKTGSDPELLTNVNGMLFFVADDGIHGKELWKTIP